MITGWTRVRTQELPLFGHRLGTRTKDVSEHRRLLAQNRSQWSTRSMQQQQQHLSQRHGVDLSGAIGSLSGPQVGKRKWVECLEINNLVSDRRLKRLFEHV